jgi:hypothetical protein
LADFIWGKSELGTTYTFTLQDANGTAINLSGRTVTLKYKAYPTPASTTSRTLTVTDAANGVCTHTLVSGDTTTAGLYSYNFEISSAGYLDYVPKDHTLHLFEVVSVV